MEIEVIRDLQQLAPLRTEWNEAVEASYFDSIFLTHEWFYAWAKNFAPANSLNIVIARDGGRIAGIMPLLRERRRVGPWTQTVLRSMSNLETYKYSFVLPKEHGGEVLETMLRHLSRNSSWDLMKLSFLPEDMAGPLLVRECRGNPVFGVRSEIHMESPYVAIAGTWDEYVDTRDKKVRKNLDYFERRLQKEGTVEVLEITDEAGLDQMVHDAFEIEKSSWKGAHGTAISGSQAHARFYLELAQSMSRRQNFRLCFLTLNGAKIAFDYCLPYKQDFNVLKTGYNPAFAKNSPGRVLRKSVLRTLYKGAEYRIYDLLGAQDAWKEEWADSAQRLIHIQLYNKRPLAMAQYLALSAIDRGKEGLRHNPRLFAAVKKAQLWLSGRPDHPSPDGPTSGSGQSSDES